MKLNYAKSVHSVDPCTLPFGQQSCENGSSLEKVLGHIVKGEINLKLTKKQVA